MPVILFIVATVKLSKTLVIILPYFCIKFYESFVSKSLGFLNYNTACEVQCLAGNNDEELNESTLNDVKILTTLLA